MMSASNAYYGPKYQNQHELLPTTIQQASPAKENCFHHTQLKENESVNFYFGKYYVSLTLIILYVWDTAYNMLQDT
jgi:hypothetical protein